VLQGALPTDVAAVPLLLLPVLLLLPAASLWCVAGMYQQSH